MTRYLLPTDSMHGAAAICDYLEDRVGAEDGTYVVRRSDECDRDDEDATNVLRVGLHPATVDPARTDGDCAMGLLDAAREVEADVIVPGPRGTDGADADPLVDRVLDGADRPVVVLPDD